MVLTKVAFWIFEILRLQFFTIFFSFSLTWNPMGGKLSKGYSSKLNFSKLLLNFLLISPDTKILFCILEILSLQFFMNF